MATIDYSIRDVEKLMKFDGTAKNVEVSRLTAPGENFLSLVLRLDFKIEKDGKPETVSTVAKCLPLNMKKDDINMHKNVMKKEIIWYSEILPLLKNFANENKMELDFIPEYYGSRLSLDSSKNEADEDSVLLLENLIPQGYQNDDRYVGFDLVTAKTIVKKMATFHAISIAMKINKPELFQVIKDLLLNTKPPKDQEKLPKDQEKPPGISPEIKKSQEMFLEKLENFPEFAPYFPKVKALFEMQLSNPDILFKQTKEPWNAVCHNDLWVNNIMVNHREEKGPLVKIVDFQMCSYGSYTKDLLFFLLSSVRNDVAKEHLDDLLRIYYDEFVLILKKVNSNLELTYEEYLEEIRTVAAKSKIGHLLFFTTIIFGEKGTGRDVTVEGFEPTDTGKTISKMSQNQKDKMLLIGCEAEKRNWL